MSRSFKRNPIWKDHNKGMKTLANRKVRRKLKCNLDFNVQYKSYKKMFCSYDICDYRSLVPKSFEGYVQQEIERLHHWRDFGLSTGELPDKRTLYRQWLKYRQK